MEPRPGALSAQEITREEDLERVLRPRTLREFVGQQKIKDNLSVFLQAALQRDETLDHVLLSGPPGLGKCITASSLVLTDGGYVRFSSLLPGDLAPGESRPLEITVCGIHGAERTSHVYASGFVPTVRVRTGAGFTLEGTPHHPVLVASPQGPTWKKLATLGPRDYVAIGRGLQAWAQDHAPDHAYETIGAPAVHKGDDRASFGADMPMAAGSRTLAPDQAGMRASSDVVDFLASGAARRPDGSLEIVVESEADAHEAQVTLASVGVITQRFERFGVWMLRLREAGAAGPAHGYRDDVVPYAEELMHAALPGSAEAPCRREIAHWLSTLPVEARGHSAVRSLRALASDWIYWDSIAEVSTSAAEAFDFVVPGTHSFVANGFFNHNTTLGYIIAEEMGAGITTSSGPVLDKPASIAGILTNLKEGDVLFIDEIHRLSPIVEEYLYSAMEDYHIDIVIDSGPNARTVQISLKPFTLVGATTRKGLLTAPLRARFGIDFRYDYYTADLLMQIIERSARIFGIAIDKEGAMELARRSRGTPRIANRLLRRTRDFAQVTGDGRITGTIADHALSALDVDAEGLDDMDSRILLTLIQKFAGGPTGLSNLAISVGEDSGTIEEVYEPYLIQEGYLERTPRGRVATPRAYRHFNIQTPPSTGDLFSP